MSEPIVFVSHFRIKEGKLDAFRQHTKETSLLLEADKPRTSAFLPYASDDGRVTIVHVFAAPTPWTHTSKEPTRGRRRFTSSLTQTVGRYTAGRARTFYRC